MPDRIHPTIKSARFTSLLLLISGACSFLLCSCLNEHPTSMSWRAAATTYAGDGAIGFQDGDAKERARFADPFGVAVDSEGNVFVADAGDNNRIRKIAPDGKVGTLAGGQEGYNDGAGVAAQFNTPSALALDREGNVYVADTSNNRIRKVTQTGVVTTLAGDGTPGFRDGAANSAQFNAPLGIAVDERGNVYVADTYNDRVRQITTDGQVKTLAGGDAPGYMDGAAAASLFDTPCSIAVAPNGELFIADTGNDRIRKLSNDGQVTTMNLSLKIEDGVVVGALDAPLGLALTHDGFLYVTESERGRVVQIAPDGTARVLAGAGGSGFADGEGTSARFNNPTGVAVDPNGSVYVADSANYLVRKIVPLEDLKNARPVESPKALPNLSAEILGVKEFVWPVDPPKSPHEVVATMGEVRGSFDGESRHHLHSGIDIQGALGAPVRSVFDEKITRPIADWGFGSLNEGIRVGVMTYIHLRVGRDAKDEPIDNSPFDVLRDADGKVLRVRVKRGTRLRVGDALGTINRMYHVHLNLGPWGAEINPLRLPFVGFGDSIAPTIERDGIQVLDASGQRLTTLRDGRLIVRGDVSIVVDAYDRVDGNLARRRLGLYKLGYQILKADGTPAPGFDEPRVQIEFERMPLEREAVQIAYAESSGITVYGSASTRFLYVVTNTVRDRRAAVGVWRASELPQGDYILRILAADYAGNEATTGRDLPITIE